MAEQTSFAPPLPLFAPDPETAAAPAPSRAPGRTGPGAPPASEPEVEVRISTRRKKSAVSFWEDGRIVVVVPSHVAVARRGELVDWLVARTRARRPGAGASDDELVRRAADLADRYVDGVRPASVRWVTNQHKRWGSCTADTREIRLSHRLQDVPGWVLDAVLVHELTHLVHPDHSVQFHRVADRYPRQREASVFLDGFTHGLERR